MRLSRSDLTRRRPTGTAGSPAIALVSLAALQIVWGGSLPATKIGLDSLGPFGLTAARLAIASVLFLFALGLAPVVALPRTAALRLAGLGVLGFTGTQALQAIGASVTSGSVATVLASTAPLWIAVLAPLVLRESLRVEAFVGAVIALAGVALMVGAGAPTGETTGAVLGGGALLLSGGTFAVYTLLGKELGNHHPPLLFSGVSCMGAAVAALPLAFWEAVHMGKAVPTPLGLAMALYLGVAVTFFGFVIWFWGLQTVSASRAGALLFLQPISGIAISIVALGDRPTPPLAAGAGLVLLGVFLAVRH